MEVNEAMARIFDPVDGVDLVITASNPDVAFAADGPLPATFGGVEAGAGNNGKLTFPANLHGNPAISIPAGLTSTACPSGCRSSAATSPSRSCSSWPTSSSATVRGQLIAPAP